jgi:ADP-ribose pyrophosphatase
MSSPLHPWTTLSSKSIHRTSWIEVVEDQCRTDAGVPQVYTYTRRLDEGPLLIPVDADGSVWLVQQYRHPIKKIVWEFPAEGKLPHESWEDSAQRGLVEELQMRATALVDLGTFYPDPGGLDQKAHYYLATGLMRIPPSQLPKHQQSGQNEIEDLRVQNCTPAEVDAMIESGEICDNWTLAALYVWERWKKRKEG